MKHSWIISLLILYPFIIHAQTRDTIQLVNPSFEDTAGCCKVPKGWIDCGAWAETPPDIQPVTAIEGAALFGVTQEPLDGETYLALVVRERDTYEHISQKLSKPLLINQCYTFSIYLSRSDTYSSLLNYNEPDRFVDFTEPVVFRLWGGNAFCKNQQLLAISIPIVNTNWKKYNFQFKTKHSLTHIQIEAFYINKFMFPYNGNLLLDNASDIIEIDCDLLNKN